jgi:hypothetical protein
VSHDDDDLVHVHNIHQQEKGIKMWIELKKLFV